MIDGKPFGMDTGATLADANTVPTTFALVQNHPDLFNPSTIRSELQHASHVSLKVYNPPLAFGTTKTIRG